MPQPRTLPPVAELLAMREQGMTAQAIADQYGVSKGAVWQQLRKAGATGTGKRYGHLIPWTVRKEHEQHKAVVMLRLMGQQESKELRLDQQRRLDRWLSDLQMKKQVVAYDPEHGFWYAAQRECDTFPISEPEKPRDVLDQVETAQPDRCAICDTELHVGTLAVIDQISGQRRTLRVPVCVDHSLMLLNAGRRRAGLLGFSWAS
jgi:hypothetical protein